MRKSLHDWIYGPNSDKRKTSSQIDQTPKLWMHMIPEVPTYDEYVEAFIDIFKYHPDDCSITKGGIFGMSGLSVRTPNGVHLHGGLGKKPIYTDHPVLSKYNDIYYEGCGCTWGEDDNGVRYYKLDKRTGLPTDWKNTKSNEIVRRYLNKNKKEIRKRKLNRVLGNCIDTTPLN